MSEAVYLSDPEGNGVEIYADRPASTWIWQDGTVRMGTAPLDIPALLGQARGHAGMARQTARGSGMSIFRSAPLRPRRILCPQTRSGYNLPVSWWHVLCGGWLSSSYRHQHLEQPWSGPAPFPLDRAGRNRSVGLPTSSGRIDIRS
ncbi:hypothetical protein RAA17_05835 [Komagataeibacter rhaeticus]|nr:hypothetical protein [Komagataeibacter rhaeticus]